MSNDGPPRRHPRRPRPPRITARLREPDLWDSTLLTIGGQDYPCCLDDFIPLGLGSIFHHPSVNKIRHIESDREIIMRRKHMGRVSAEDLRTYLQDFDVSMRLVNHPNIVDFYGALITQGDIYMYMEVMKTSLDRIYAVAKSDERMIPERILGRMFFSVVSALEYLDDTKLRVKVNPSSILFNEDGVVKLSDYGLNSEPDPCEHRREGFKPYMAPERIKPPPGDDGGCWHMCSAVWSLGIVLVELACMEYPYSEWKTDFDQLKAIVKNPSPTVPQHLGYSEDFQDILTACLRKNREERPKCGDLLQHVFLVKHAKTEPSEVAAFLCTILDPL